MRDFDIEIAEKIFGWENNKNGPVFKGRYSNQIYAHNGDYPVVDCPNYSDNIDDAMEIVYHLNKRLVVMFEPRQKKFKAYFDKNGEECYPVSFAKTLPLAICLAALKTIEDK